MVGADGAAGAAGVGAGAGGALAPAVGAPDVAGAPVVGAPGAVAGEVAAGDDAGAAPGFGASVLTGAGVVSKIDAPAPPVPRLSSASVSDRAMKMVARIAVVLVNRLAVPRPDMNAPIPCELPMPRPPPSLRWISTTPIRARVTNKWMINRTVFNDDVLSMRSVGRARPIGQGGRSWPMG